MKSTSEDDSERWQAPQFPDGVMPTAGELETLQQQAYDEAYAEAWQKGREAGHAEGLSAAEKETQQRWKLLDEGLSHLAQPLEDLDEALETQLLQMVIALVGRMFRRQLNQDPDAIKGLVRDAVRLLPVAANTVEIHVHPDDAKRLAEIAPDNESEQTTRWRVIGDPAMTLGGCRVTCGQSSIDGTVEGRLQQIANSLVGDERA